MVTIKTENCLRLLLLNTQGATPVLRETVEHFVKQTSNKTLGDFLLAFQDFFKTMKSKRILSASEYNKLLKGTAVDTNEWDTTLVCFVLLHCCTVTGKMHELKSMLLKVANMDLDKFVKTNKANIDKYKGVYLSSEQYNIIFPANYMPLNIELLDMEIITFLLLKVCGEKVQNSAIELLKRTLQTEMELKNSNLYLAEFLKCHESLLEKVELQSEIDKSQFEQLFPPNGDIPDINKWDNHTLRIVVLKCSSSIKQQTLEATKILRTIRNECLAHRDNFEMSSIEYNDQSTNLIKAMKVLITEENLPIQATINDELEKITEGPIDIKSTLEILRSFYTDHQLILNHLDTVENTIMAMDTKVDRIDSKLDTLSQEMLKRFDKLAKMIPDSTYSEKAIIKCVNKIIVVKSKTRDGKLKAENIIKTAMKNAGQNSTDKLKAAIVVLFTTVLQDDRTIFEINHGSIVLTIKCPSLKALHGLLRYIESDDIVSHLQALASAVTEIVGEAIKLTVCLSEKSLLIACEDVIRFLSEIVAIDVANTSTLQMQIHADTLQQLVDEFKGEHDTFQLNRVGLQESRLLDTFLKRFDTIPESTYSEISEIRCVDMIIVVKSETTNGKQKAENSIKTAMENAGENSTEQIRAALGIIREIITEDDRIIVEVKRGSIILTIKCPSLKALHGLLRYIESDDIESHLQALASAVTEIVGEAIELTVFFSEKAVIITCEDVIRFLQDDDISKSSFRMTMRAETDEMRQVDEFGREHVKSQFVSLKDALSTYHGKDITDDVVLRSEAQDNKFVTNSDLPIIEKCDDGQPMDTCISEEQQKTDTTQTRNPKAVLIHSIQKDVAGLRAFVGKEYESKKYMNHDGGEAFPMVPTDWTQIRQKDEIEQ